MHRALERGGPVDVQVGGVAADALGASRLGEIAMATAARSTDAFAARERRGDRRGTPLAVAEARVAAEPAGATALAALLQRGLRPADGERVCVIVCGGNADPSDLS